MLKIQDIPQQLIKHRSLWHIGFWLAYAFTRVLPYYVTVMYYKRNLLEFMLFVELGFIFLVYSTLWLYRRFYTQKKYTLYFGIGLVTWSFYVFLIILFQQYYVKNLSPIGSPDWWNVYFTYLTKYYITFIVLTLAKYFKDNYIAQYYESKQKQLQIQTELQNLKAQISPHFLFNTMNNFYGLAVEKSDKLPKLMVRLSDLLRYSLYETNHVTVPISHEIDYLKNYIELEKIRLEDTLEFDFQTDINIAEAVEIAPLIFIVFIENAFKHAKNVENEAVKIQIYLRVSADKILNFEVKNNCLPNFHPIDYNKSGIGLENVRRRLEVLYPNGLHDLLVEKRDNIFHVKLKIDLNSEKL